MSASVKHLVPVEPASGHGEAVIIHVEQHGSHPLDIRLVGSEGERPYVTSLQHRHVAALRHKFKGSDDEWAAILSHFLLQQQPDIGQSDLLQGVRMVYQLKNKQLEISFRQHVQNIKVTLGQIILPEHDEFEFNPFEWVQTSAVAHAETLQQMAVLKAKIKSEDETIAKLRAQLDNFIRTKNEAETAMLQQFMTLLNEKKRKIRDQSRLLASVKVDKATAAAVWPTREVTTKARKAGASRTCKRKAPALAPEPDMAPDSDSDHMEIDQATVEEQDDNEAPEPMTPEQSDTETDDQDEAAPPNRRRSAETLTSSSGVAQGSKGKATKGKGVPPPRALPFANRTSTRSGKVSEPPPRPTAADDKDGDDGHDDDDDDDDVTEDDEEL
ncbi:hypothetical protein PTNB73_08596 [Pyrenophora teres f. teres]|uniref:XRCC4 domain containing protein n=2 Tax=Pyrenophora teres f. teres TaxID=97479 RepID=E3RF68_PYRTT|nr:hypothetical protein PTT_05732 [Pyrenophora teres f. teres 0-1]KAE8825599.1 hypothetical protein HRS9139_08709 [Pyrenophora teres f. teres]KAE8834696.1 hypothetical protein PTNB85_06029 [Pyrenophora teres f. teres]KAE8843825.1 hypothetical protein HRS9122_04928 [Pyrenophora teres f. teres]KAE8859116.1 hypothetical protein PTNB73_08596 [Pyrenophora teres f. teres]